MAWFPHFPQKLVQDGFIELMPAYKTLDLDNIKDFSLDLESEIQKMQRLEKEAKLAQIGPIWSKY